ncbi:phosphatidylglycerophosphatase A [Plesiomonas shigelloides]|nr:phosphatidylglycerophosphatase A [Plesiomonas shigelloides]QWK95827.1 phosphatidylglycerophosphatase A [Plesiomonas shigelloides]
MREGLDKVSLRNPVHFLALGFGSGLSPVVPGTMGTLAAVPVWWLLAHLSLPWYLLAIVLSFIVGVYLCDKTSRDMQVHDSGAIVWDEFVGLFITMLALPAITWQWVLTGFVLFRFFDMVKPWPIRWFDRKVDGGFGIMIDDVIAGIIAAACLWLGAQWWA